MSKSPATPLKTLVEKAVADAAAGDLPSLTALMTPRMANLLTPDSVSHVAAEFKARGAIQNTEIVSQESFLGSTEAKFTVYLTHGTIAGTLTEDSGGKISGLKIVPGIKQSFSAYITKADVRLPFSGTWYAGWGGKDPKKNLHADNRAQKYAYDFVIRKNGKTFHGDGRQNTDYYAYGQPVLAPVAGTVAMVVDGIPENKPGEMNPYFAPGNCVVIDDGKNEWAYLVHLQPGQIKLKVKDHVAIGQLLGYCGNSGNSSEPHLHFHMQNALNIADADGLPITFRYYVEEGKKVAAGVAEGQVSLANQ